MQVHAYRPNKTSRYLVSIDPGLATSGIVIYDIVASLFYESTLLSEDYKSSPNFNENLPSVVYQISRYIDYIKTTLGVTTLSDCSIVIEHPRYNPDFTFSIGLSMLVSSFISVLLQQDTGTIYLVPPMVTQYFIQERNLKDSHIKSWVHFFLSEFSTIKFSSYHTIDAFLLNLFIHWVYYKSVYKLTGIREPVVNIKYHDYLKS